jgi:hypothetical protein
MYRLAALTALYMCAAILYFDLFEILKVISYNATDANSTHPFLSGVNYTLDNYTAGTIIGDSTFYPNNRQFDRLLKAIVMRLISLGIIGCCVFALRYCRRTVALAAVIMTVWLIIFMLDLVSYLENAYVEITVQQVSWRGLLVL